VIDRSQVTFSGTGPTRPSSFINNLFPTHQPADPRPSSGPANNLVVEVTMTPILRSTVGTRLHLRGSTKPPS
jgi:hypothetical protein